MEHSSFAHSVDQLTLAKARTGDREAMAKLYRLFSAPVYTLALRICSGKSDAEDVVQECFVELFRKLDQYRGDAPFWAWLRRIAVNKALMHLRKERVKAVPMEDFRTERELSEKVTRIHDPSDLTRARELASQDEVVPVGILYRNENVPCYDEIRKARRILTPAQIEQAFEIQLDRFAVK